MTALWTSDVLASVTGGTATRPFAATGVSIDSRTVQPGDVFVALLGSTDGHAHVADALARGASGAVVHDAGGLDGAPLLVVADTFAALHAMGHAGRARFRGRMVAVTGSVVSGALAPISAGVGATSGGASAGAGAVASPNGIVAPVTGAVGQTVNVLGSSLGLTRP